MPRNKLISWTPANDARLILTILTVENLHPNCEAVASSFGGAVDAQCITNRLNRLRRQAAKEGIVARPGVAVSAKGGKRNGAGNSGNGGKKNLPAEDDSEGDMPSRPSLARNNPSKGQKVLTGRVTKGRNPVKKDTKVSIKIDDDSDHDDLYGSGNEVEVQDGEDMDAPVKKEEGEDGDEKEAA